MDIIFGSLMIGILVVIFGAMFVGFLFGSAEDFPLFWSFFSVIVPIVCTGVVLSQLSKLKESLKPLLAQKERQPENSTEAAPNPADPADPPSNP